jgi:hypothetical protein
VSAAVKGACSYTVANPWLLPLPSKRELGQALPLRVIGCLALAIRQPKEL